MASLAQAPSSERSRPGAGARAAALALAFAAVTATALAGGRFTARSVATWYPELLKPTWTPPAWLFGPVWTALYVAMAIAAYLVWRTVGFGRARVALLTFAAQLVLNAAWSWLFFARRSPGAALVEIALLWLAILATTVLFRRASRTAAWLLVPYLAWTGFAAALNFAIWRLNS